jgi:chemotaxis protein CheC
MDKPLDAQDKQLLSGEEKDILQEIMNIAFGRASADLAKVIDIYVELSVPDVRVMPAYDLPDYIACEIKENMVSIVEQGFLGKFRGMALLVFPAGSGRDLFTMLGDWGEESAESVSLADMERETLMELGNILIGACVGKVAELLDDVVTYNPPRITIENHPKKAISTELFEPDSMATVMRTLFCFKERNINGYFFLINSHASFGWLKKALHLFLEKYA